MTDSTGAVVWSAYYKPFGAATVTVSTITNNLRFPGQYYDAETGLNYNYFRDYNPLVGRYIEADPIGLRGGVNPYRYVGNNPVTWIDPFGLFTLPNNPSGLPPGWVPDPSHQDPNGLRFRDNGGTGRPLDWHPGRPGDPGWGGRDHWHDPDTFGREHLPPGTEVPDPIVPPTTPWWGPLIPDPFPIVPIPVLCLIFPQMCMEPPPCS